jgi:methyltransferase
MLIRVAVCGLMGVARLIEMRQSRQNLQASGESRESRLNQLIFPLIIALHVTVIATTLLRGSRRPRLGWFALLLAVQPLRWWTLKTLGVRWNARGAVPEAMEVETGGPYAFIRHPNYSIVAVELASLPAAFGLDGLAIGGSLVNAALLAVRIREEEALLFELPGYREQFGAKPRFIPFVV